MAIDINLQPTDRCVLDYGTTSLSRSQRFTKDMTLLSTGGTETMLYKGSTTVTFDGEVQSVTIYQNLSSPSDAIFSYSISGNTVTFNCNYSASDQGSTPTSATVNASVTYAQTVENKKEVFQIKDSNGNYKWFKCKPVTINFDTNMIEDIEWSANEVTTGGGSTANEPGIYYIRAGGSWSDIVIHPKDGYTVSLDDLTDAYNAGLLDLTDVANLTLNDFAEIIVNIEAEEDAVIDPTTRVIASQYILDADAKLLNTNAVTTQYRVYIDDEGSYGMVEGARGGDIFVAYDYLTPPWGDAPVPVIYKTDYENGDVIDEGYPPDYDDIYYYMGQEEIEGVLCDKWRKTDPQFTYPVTQGEKYLYTNIITTEGTSITEVLPVLVSYSELESYADPLTITIENPNDFAVRLQGTTVAIPPSGGVVQLPTVQLKDWTAENISIPATGSIQTDVSHAVPNYSITTSIQAKYNELISTSTVEAYVIPAKIYDPVLSTQATTSRAELLVTNRNNVEVTVTGTTFLVAITGDIKANLYEWNMTLAANSNKLITCSYTNAQEGEHLETDLTFATPFVSSTLFQQDVIRTASQYGTPKIDNVTWITDDSDETFLVVSVDHTDSDNGTGMYPNTIHVTTYINDEIVSNHVYTFDGGLDQSSRWEINVSGLSAGKTGRIEAFYSGNDLENSNTVSYDFVLE